MLHDLNQRHIRLLPHEAAAFTTLRYFELYFFSSKHRNFYLIASLSFCPAYLPTYTNSISHHLNSEYLIYFYLHFWPRGVRGDSGVLQHLRKGMTSFSFAVWKGYR